MLSWLNVIKIILVVFADRIEEVNALQRVKIFSNPMTNSQARLPRFILSLNACHLDWKADRIIRDSNLERTAVGRVSI